MKKQKGYYNFDLNGLFLVLILIGAGFGVLVNKGCEYLVDKFDVVIVEQKGEGK